MNRLPTDAELIAQCLVGDRDVFAALVERYEKGVYGIALSILRNPAAAEDAAQEAFVRAFSQLATLRRPERFAAWLGKIARRQALSARRAQHRHVGLRDQSVAAPETRPLLEAVDELPEHYRVAIVLRFMENRSYEEMSALLGVPLSTVQGRLYKARKFLRAALGGTP